MKYTIYTQRWCVGFFLFGIFLTLILELSIFFQTCPLLVFAAMGKLFIYLQGAKSEFNL